MPVTHHCFLDIARDSVDKSGEQWVRNAVSRAYYSMFHSALRLTGGYVPNEDEKGSRLMGGTHQRFADYLCDGTAAQEYSLDVTEIKKIGLALKTAHHKRVTADYKLNRKINKIDALTTIKSAEEMDLTIDGLISSKERVI
ncbi:hypothetical protein ACOIE4_003667 [Klebsiella variicola]|uniref:Uncharacterized protein n=2 Tax=root TaxID=1 RepID=A0A5B9N044_9CAUD|nr:MULTISPECIES: hypothetical protein [Klebsiella]QEG04456.1 hypothetical protein CHRON_58 [Klebsiella phage vB_Kpn_Chronis]HDS7780399.1 hypothetical protein [Klebsiella pneumoniae subsp. ozaenae]EIY1881673.1 hypothetical protein [Klebsiella pneumoniae]EKJ7636190.1 hypothetical protein [Klebsiella pneumoniae]EKX6524988.1 hypothetical protein [Klebsiella pneumoniae]